MAVPPAPASLARLAARVDDRIGRLLDDEIVRWEKLDADLAEPLEILRELVLAGGKRLRPAFCHWAFVGSGGDPGDPVVVDAGAALELLHTFALIHDDVMDGSSRRRGLDSVHHAFERRHRDSRWHGEGRRFGEGVAILVGDLAFVYADLLLVGAPRPAVDVFNELRLEVNIGQYLDLLGTVRRETSAETARRICQYKSGKYTVERPLHLGAALQLRMPELEEPLSAFGLPLGEAFQLRDDLLGAFGDSEVTGKPVGEDLREGKPTPLYALAVAAADGDDADVLRQRFGAPDMSAADVARIQAVFDRTGARDAVEARIDELLGRALAALESLPVTTEARDELAQLAAYVVERDR